MPAHRSLLAAFVVLWATAVPAASEEDPDWTVVTIARNGSWGVATAVTQVAAIADAIRDCQEMSDAQSDCGAEFTAVRSGWTLALLCGDYKVLVADKALEEAKAAALNREIDLKLFYVPDLPRCQRLLTVDPRGVVATTKVTLLRRD
jgi:hypothetical protein